MKLIQFILLSVFTILALGESVDEKFLDEIEKNGFLYFWEQADPITGQVKDRAFANGSKDDRHVSSIAATGFGLSVLVIAHNRNYFNQSLIEKRVMNTLKFIWENLEGHKGFFYHFVDMKTGKRVWNCELSSIDTAILINGVLTSKEYFVNNEFIKETAMNIYRRVDYKWMLNGQKVLSMGWKPEEGFLKDSWNRYCELMMLVLQAIGSPSHPIPAEYWHSFARDKYKYENYTFITVKSGAPLFVHQFSHAWYDFQGKHDNYADYFHNSVVATKAHKLWMTTEMAQKFPLYDNLFWGVTASDTINGYIAWGGPPIQGPIDGSVVPCATAGSIPFLPFETIAVLKYLKTKYPRSWHRYGFIDAFNPDKNWYNQDVIGIDVGISVLMVENFRTRFIWNTFMKNTHVLKSMEMAGFKRNSGEKKYFKELEFFLIIISVIIINYIN
ncbi:hypothetical protein BpHYR1_011799 [Brachionus plicatilis]|uniref:Glycoamylase-like domain-containing protein n=1 Tax=Brachionus plicatilis TaxID=10195 RepID=A0A3M7T8M6_BRAPC|nr:hypothetical protein BpHYR1_011799 [Brachionus plicatilis]